MKVKNSDVLNASNTINNISLRTSDIQKRWELAKVTRPILVAGELIRVEINKIIEEFGVAEDGQKTIKSDNKQYLELMNCDCDLDVKLSLELLQSFNLDAYDLVSLEMFIEDK